MPKNIKIALWVLALVIVYSLLSSISFRAKEMFNTSIDYKAQYSAKEQDLVTTYDAYYLSFSDQYSLANINKEAFVQVTNIIMTNRADGKNLAWKWLTENQPIPYEQFTSFYANLTQFAKERYNAVLAIEQSKQKIVQSHNYNLKVFPNNWYNKVLKIEPLKYEYGYISDSTRAKFKLK